MNYQPRSPPQHQIAEEDTPVDRSRPGMATPRDIQYLFWVHGRHFDARVSSGERKIPLHQNPEPVANYPDARLSYGCSLCPERGDLIFGGCSSWIIAVSPSPFVLFRSWNSGSLFKCHPCVRVWCNGVSFESLTRVAGSRNVVVLRIPHQFVAQRSRL